MDEFNYLQLLEDDDSELLEAVNLLEAENHPLFGIESEENFSMSSDVLCPVKLNEVRANDQNEQQTTTNEAENCEVVDVSRFPEVSTENIEELRSLAHNKNTSRSTKQWMNVFKSWCSARRIQNVNIETMAPEKLDKLLERFYAEVKKQDGGDYEPESLKIMQCAIERHLKEHGYKVSIVRGREFRKSQETLNAKAISLRQDGKGKRPNKAEPLEPEEETALWEKGQLGDFNARVLTNTNFKNLTEQLGLRGRQEHYDSYVEDFIVRQQEDGSKVIEFREGPTKTRSGGLRIKRRSTPQLMFSTNGGERDPVRLFELWLSKRPEGMKDNGPLYLSIIARPKSSDVWYTKVRMGQNTIGNIMKSMASCLNTTKKLTNHSMRKTLVSKLKKAGQARNIICEITGHARESSLDDYDQIDENQRRNLSHIISGYQVSTNVRQPSKSCTNNLANINPASSSTALNAPTIQQQSLEGSHQPMCFNSNIQPNRLTSFPPQYQMAAFNNGRASSTIPVSNYSGCTINNYFNKSPLRSPHKKRRRTFMLDSDDED